MSVVSTLKGIKGFLLANRLSIDLAIDCNEKWIASITEGEFKDNGLLRSPVGRGYSPSEAICKYFIENAGCTLVVGAYLKERREMQMPIIIGGD